MKSKMIKMLLCVARAPLGFTVVGNAVNILTADKWVSLWNAAVDYLLGFIPGGWSYFPRLNANFVNVFTLMALTVVVACKQWVRFYYRKHCLEFAFRHILDLSCDDEIYVKEFPVRIRHITDDKLSSYIMNIDGNDHFVDVHFFLLIEKKEQRLVDEFIEWQEKVLPNNLKDKDLGKRNLDNHICLHSHKEFSMFDFNHNFDVKVQNDIKNWDQIIEKFRVYCCQKQMGSRVLSCQTKVPRGVPMSQDGGL